MSEKIYVIQCTVIPLITWQLPLYLYDCSLPTVHTCAVFLNLRSTHYSDQCALCPCYAQPDWGTRAAVPPPFRLGHPALSGSRPL